MILLIKFDKQTMLTADRLILRVEILIESNGFFVCNFLVWNVQCFYE